MAGCSAHVSRGEIMPIPVGFENSPRFISHWYENACMGYFSSYEKNDPEMFVVLFIMSEQLRHH